jgi:hypothetical protein
MRRISWIVAGCDWHEWPEGTRNSEATPSMCALVYATTPSSASARDSGSVGSASHGIEVEDALEQRALLGIEAEVGDERPIPCSSPALSPRRAAIGLERHDLIADHYRGGLEARAERSSSVSEAERPSPGNRKGLQNIDLRNLPILCVPTVIFVPTKTVVGTKTDSTCPSPTSPTARAKSAASSNGRWSS